MAVGLMTANPADVLIGAPPGLAPKPGVAPAGAQHRAYSAKRFALIGVTSGRATRPGAGMAVAQTHVLGAARPGATTGNVMERHGAKAERGHLSALYVGEACKARRHRQDPPAGCWTTRLPSRLRSTNIRSA